MKKLIVTIMGDKGEKFMDMCIKSVLTADKVIFCWGEEDIKTKNKFLDWKNKYPEKLELISTPYNQEDKMQNGKTRNFYLNYLKNNYAEDWNLALDLDEVVEDLNEIKKVIQYATDGVYSVKMRHFEGTLGQEDATQKEHNVINRLFKISCADKYPEVEHPVLQPINNDVKSGVVVSTTIWHLGYIPNLFYFKNRYESHLAKSNMHTPEYLKEWYYQHLFGTFPKSEVKPDDIPEVILNEFGFTKDEIYFKNRKQIGMNHLLDAIFWKDFFKCETAIEIGAGLGMRVWAMNKVGINAMGTEISEYACANAVSKIHQDDIVNTKLPKEEGFDLVVCYDVLEHIDLKEIHQVADTLIAISKKNILVSVPCDTDPNFFLDKTHKICRPMSWWKRLFEDKGHKVFDVPNSFLYPNQQFYVEVKK
jgi:hypothetical protein